MTTSPSGWVGKTLAGRYQIQELLGKGGMAAVYKAYDPNLKRVVAIKLIHPHLTDEGDFIRRFEEEATAVAQLRHPNIVQVFDFSQHEGMYFIVFEFVPGETMQALLKRYKDNERVVEIQDVVRYGSQVGEAIAYAHGRGLVHRDIKPANVIVNMHDEAILMDFGIVKLMGGTTHTATGAVVGTARYMSPEQIKGEKVDERSDLYSLGVMLFEMLGGRAPYEADSAMTLMMMHVKDPVPDISKLRKDIPADMVRIVNKALAKEPSQRWQTAGELVKALRQANLSVLAGSDATLLESAARAQTTAPAQQPPKTMQAVANTPVLTAQPAQSDPTSAQAPQLAKKGVSLWMIMAGALALFVCVVVAGILLLNQMGIFGKVGLSETEISMTAAAVIQETEAANNSLNNPKNTDVPATTEVPVPTHTSVPPTHTAIPPTETLSPPTETPTPEGPVVRILGITIDSYNRYVVEYETWGYTETLPGMHVHFFFDTVTEENAGSPGYGPWILYGGPRPFTGYRTSDKPAAATRMCALVANANHSIIPASGNCWNLPAAQSVVVPSNTSIPPTSTPVPPTWTNTAVPPTWTDTTVPPSDTPLPTDTPVPATSETPNAQPTIYVLTPILINPALLATATPTPKPLIISTAIIKPGKIYLTP
ncbi:MAG TPA: protein kinase [Anaerolineales bacterium]|nr:protein kinase [Anaerolineales bacterium]